MNNLTITLFSSCQEIFQPCRLRQLCNTLGRNPVWKKSVSGYWILYFPHSFNITINQNSSASFSQNVCWSWLQLSSVRDYKGRALIKKKIKILGYLGSSLLISILGKQDIMLFKKKSVYEALDAAGLLNFIGRSHPEWWKDSVFFVCIM